MTDQERFEKAKEKIIGKNRERNGIGTLAEKTVHAILKNYYEQDERKHEVPIEGSVADIFTGEEIIEIQTRNFDRMRPKLEKFLPLYPVTVIFPIPHVKKLIWIDEETGELSSPRKSPLKGSPYLAFPELYKIKPFLKEKNLHFKLILLDMEEYRLLNGWSRDKKKGSCRFDRVPVQLVEEVTIDCILDYMQFVPYELEGEFTVREFAKAAHIRRELARVVVHILAHLDILEMVGKKGREYLYIIRE